MPKCFLLLRGLLMYRVKLNYKFFTLSLCLIQSLVVAQTPNHDSLRLLLQSRKAAKADYQEASEMKKAAREEMAAYHRKIEDALENSLKVCAQQPGKSKLTCIKEARKVYSELGELIVVDILDEKKESIEFRQSLYGLLVATGIFVIGAVVDSATGGKVGHFFK